MKPINQNSNSNNFSTSIKQDKKGILSFIFSLKFPHWMLLIYPAFLFAIHRNRDVEAVYDLDKAAYLQIGFAGIIGLYLLFRVVSKKYILQHFLFRRPLVWLFLYYLLSIVSTTWSATPQYTLYRSIEALLFLVLTIDASGSLDFDDMVKFCALFGLSVIIFWQLAPFFYEFSLKSLHSSEVSGTIISLAFLGVLLPGKQWKIVYAIIVGSILLATSSASYLAVLIGIGGAIMFSRGAKRFLDISLIIIGILIIWICSLDFINVLFWGKSEVNIMTATGRIPVWQWVYEEFVVQKPFFGYGFGVGETLARLYNFGGLRLQHMHNVVMGALANLGFAGLTLFLLFLLNNVLLMLQKKCPHRSLFIGGAFAVTVNALSISSLTSPISLGFVGHALFFVMFACLLNDIKLKKAYT